MIKNYIKIGLRNLVRHKLFTSINILGLGFGLACCLLIGAYILNELSYDRFHSEPENVSRVLIESTSSGNTRLSAVTPRFLSSAMAETLPEIESATQFRIIPRTIVYDDKEFYDANFAFSDSAFFKVFTFSTISENKVELLTKPNSAVITKSYAEKIFGEDDPIGKVFQLQLNMYGKKTVPLQVAAVINDVPDNSHFSFDCVVPYSLLVQQKDRAGNVRWGLSEMNTYVRFNQQLDEISFNKKLDDFVDRSGGNQNQSHRKIILQPLTDIHLADSIPFDHVKQTNIRDIYIFAGIALLVLLIASMNYILLSTARYTKRIKEVGIRKIIGATQSKLMLQFLIETILMVLLALPLTIVVVELSYQKFSELLGSEFHINFLSNSILFWGGLALLIFFIVAAGLYPALFFAKLKSVASLKGQSAGINSSHNIRKSLIITQFSITIVLLICVGIMFMQLQFTRSIDLGYKSENILVIKSHSMKQQAKVLKQAAHSYSNINEVALTSWLPGFLSASTTMEAPNGDGIIETQFMTGDCDLLKTFQIEVIEGRDFDCDNVNDILDPYSTGDVDKDLLPKVSIILNETAVKKLGLSSPIGRELNYSALQGTVIGVIKDIHNLSLYDAIKPVVIQYSDLPNYLAVSYQPGTEAQVLHFLKNEWEKLSPNNPMDFFFLEEHIRKLYSADENLMALISWFASLAIILSCLGLFGLASFIAERRTKEIGVRKVLGATIASVTTLLSKDFVKLVLLANIIAWPVAYYAMNKWLQDFAYSIEIKWWIFLLAGGVALFIALATVSSLAFRAATANPVKSLKYE